MFIEEKKYKTILDSVTNVCVDVVLRYREKLLLIKRTEEPMKGVPWPVGGRIHKGETSENSARRKIKEEIGIDYHAPLIPIGFYEDTYSANSFSDDTSYSTISIVWAGVLTDKQAKKIETDSTADGYGFYTRLPRRFKITMFSDFANKIEELDNIDETNENPQYRSV
jgi:ADP-ribose pyrophosphatase YjhB (NUDIX family)